MGVVIQILCVALTIFSSSAYSKNDDSDKIKKIKDPTTVERSQLKPSNPVSQTPLGRAPPEGCINCTRIFSFRGQLYPLDSYYRKDAERLRLLIDTIPEAVRELDDYQKNRENAQRSAFIGSVAGLAALSAYFIRANFVPDSQPALKNILEYGVYWPGLAIMGGTFVFTFYTLYSNERHLNQAVEQYNLANPDMPIELRIQGSFFF